MPVQETWVQPLIWEDPTSHGATKPMSCNYGACALEATTTEALEPGAHAPLQEKLPQREAHTLQLESSLQQQRRPRTAKGINEIILKNLCFNPFLLIFPNCCWKNEE